MRRLALLLIFVPTAAAADGDPVAAVDRAISRWQKSCSGPTELGACTRTRTVTAKNRCAASMRTIDVRRKAKEGRAAQAALAAAADAIGKRADAGEPALAVAAARVRSAMAEAAFEHFLRLRFPTGLDFSGRKAEGSKRRFTAFLEEANKRLDAAVDAQQIVARHPGASAELRLRAIARTGQLNARFVELLFTSEIPRDVRTGDLAADKIRAYCDAIVENTEPIDQRARQAFEECAALTGPQGAWAAVCKSSSPP